MINAQLVAIILAVGGLLPLLTSFVQQPRWGKRTRTIMSVAVSVLAGLVTYVTQFGLNWTDPSTAVVTIVGVILASSTAYKTIWKPSGVSPALEVATSPHPEGVVSDPVVISDDNGTAYVFPDEDQEAVVLEDEGGVAFVYPTDDDGNIIAEDEDEHRSV